MGKLQGVEKRYPVGFDDLLLVEAMREDLAGLSVPVLQHTNAPHEYLFISFLDGTGHDKSQPKLGLPSTVSLLHDEAHVAQGRQESRIGVSYSSGIGTQSNPMRRVLDGMFASTWEEGIKHAYRALSAQTGRWLDADPNAKIRFVGIGYSRGAVQVAGLARLIDRYGIVSPIGLSFGHDEYGNIAVMSHAGVLVPPGHVPQAALLLDPVATQMPSDYDARLPPSVISRVAVMARHEQRRMFPHQAIVTTTSELGADGLSLRMIAPGGHSNVGGGNAQAGLEILTGNLAVDYLNLLRDEPLFTKRALPPSLEEYARYQKIGMTGAFGFTMDRDDQRDERHELANCTIVEPCRGSEPVDMALARTLDYRRYQPDPFEQFHLYEMMTRITERDVQAISRIAPAQVPHQSMPQSPQHSRQHSPQASAVPCLPPVDELTRLLEQDIFRKLAYHDPLLQLSADRLLHAATVARSLGYEPGGRWDAMIVGNHLHMAHAGLHRSADRAALDLTEPVPALPLDAGICTRRQAEDLQHVQERHSREGPVRVM